MFQRNELHLLPLLVRRDQLFLQLAVLLQEVGLQVLAEQAIDHADAARRVEHMDRRAMIGRSDLHGGVFGAGGGAADQERDVKAACFHLFGDVDHFVEARRDQA